MSNEKYFITCHKQKINSLINKRNPKFIKKTANNPVRNQTRYIKSESIKKNQMVLKHLKNATLFIIREMEIKTTMQDCSPGTSAEVKMFGMICWKIEDMSTLIHSL